MARARGLIVLIALVAVPGASFAAPYISSMSVGSGPVGTSVTLTGTGFGATQGTSTVTFNGTAGTPTTWSTTSIVVPVPSGASTGDVVVTVAGVASNAMPFTVTPHVSAVSPNSAGAGMPVTITGTNFGSSQGSSSALFSNGQVTASPTSWSDTSITTPVPQAAITGQVNVRVGAYTSNGVSFTVLPTPTIAQMSPTTGPIGTWVTIAGTNFGTSQGTSTVTFNGVLATTVTSWSATSIVLAVPPGTTTGNVVVTVSGVSSAGTLFTKTTAAPISQVVQVQPANAATSVPLNSRVVVRFAQPVPPVSVVNGIITLAQGSTNIAGTVAQSNDGLSLTFIPSQNLVASTSYAVAVQDIAADQTTPMFQSTFTTGTTTDTVAPRVVQVSPVSAAASVPINAPLVVQFTKPMDPSTLTPQAFAVTDAGVAVSGMVQVDASGLTASFIPSAPLGVGHSISGTLLSSIRDSAGNALSGGGGFSFTTSFSPDSHGPSLVGTSPANGATAIPLNANIVLQFDEPLNVISASSGLQVLAGGQPIAGGIALSDSNKRITFTPTGALAANTTYTVTTTPQITDVAGFAILNPGNTTFATGTASDTTTPTVSAWSPANVSVGAPTNTLVQLQFSKAINALTVTASTILFTPSAATSNLLPGTITVSADSKIATFAPSSPLLANTTYLVRATAGITDIEGHPITAAQASFTTGVSASTTAPTVTTISPQDGATGVAVNARVDVVTSSTLSAASVAASAITVSASGNQLAGTVTLSSSRSTLTWTPTALLIANTLYTVSVSGVTDQAGNTLVPFTASFTTGASSTADTTKPSVASVSPTNGATGVSVGTPIVLTFNEAMDGSTVNNSSVTFTPSTSVGTLAGSYSLNSAGTVLTFTPSTPLPGSTTITVRVNSSSPSPTDLSGNMCNSFVSSFTTAATSDTTPPTVVSVTPADGSTNMGLNTNPVITFSESLNRNTLVSNNFGLFANGSRVSAGVSYSADNRVVTLSPATLPPRSTVDVVVTSGVKDLSGNSLANFVSQFTTADQFDYTFPAVSAQRPGNGAFGVPLNSNIVLYINEPMNVASVQNALHVSQNGVLVSGTTQVTNNGQVVQFTPAAPWQYDALMQVFLDSTALDTDGIALTSYQGSFRTVSDSSASAPTIVSTSPTTGTTGVPTNAVLDLQFDQPLDPASVTGSSILCAPSGGGWIQGAVSLLYGGKVLHFIPRYALAASTSVTCQISTSLRSTNGVAFAGTALTFSTGSAPDTTVPTIVSISPPNGSSNVGDNAIVRLVFSKAIDPLTVNSSTVQLTSGNTSAVLDSISFSSNNQSVLLVPHAPFPDSTQMTLAITGITDVSGNPVAAQTTQFITGAGPDLQRPLAMSTNPSANAVDVPLNAVMVVQINEPVDPGTVNTNSVTLSTAGNVVPGTVSLSSDGQTITFLPSAPLTPNTIYSMYFVNGGVADLSGNLLNSTGSANDFTFTTGTASSTAAPQVTGVSPANGATSIPTNAQVMVQFNEPVNAARLSGVTLSLGGTPVNITKVLSNGNQTLTLIPALPLSANSSYTVTVSGVQDLSGNLLASPITATFTTSAGANLISPSVASVSPVNGASNQSITSTVVRVTFAYPMNPLTVSAATFQLYPNTTHIPVPGTISMSTDGLTLTFTPSQTLDPGTVYVVNLTGGELDFEGRGLIWSSTFTTAQGSAGLSPVIASLNTTTATICTRIFLNGTYFGTSQGTSTVTFNGIAGTIYSWSDTQIFVYVPTGATSGPVVVTVNGVASNGIVFNVQATPTITSLSTGSAPSGTSVTITGTNFGNTYDAPSVLFSNSYPTAATSWTSTSLQFVVPATPLTGAVTLTVKVNGISSAGTSFTITPTPQVSSLSPSSGVPGTSVSISGSYFCSTQGTSTILFNGVSPASVSSWSNTSITAVAPSNVTTGPVTVTVNSVPSNSNQVFTVNAPAIGNLTPPAAAPGALVDINGSGFYTQGLTTQVFLNGVQLQIAYYGGNPTYPYLGTNQLTVRIPSNVTSGNITVVIGSTTSNAMPFTVEGPPTITSISPASGQIGSWPIVISGSGFGATQSSSTVSFYPGINAQIVSWSDTEIQAVVPEGTSTGAISMQVGTLSAQGPSFHITNNAQLTDSLGNQSSYATAITAGSWVLSSSSGSGCSSCSVRATLWRPWMQKETCSRTPTTWDAWLLTPTTRTTT